MKRRFRPSTVKTEPRVNRILTTCASIAPVSANVEAPRTDPVVLVPWTPPWLDESVVVDDVSPDWVGEGAEEGVGVGVGAGGNLVATSPSSKVYEISEMAMLGSTLMASAYLSSTLEIPKPLTVKLKFPGCPGVAWPASPALIISPNCGEILFTALSE